MELDIEAEIETLLLLKPETLLRGEQVRLEALTRLKRIGILAKELDWCDFEYDPALFPSQSPQQCVDEILRLCGVNHEEA